MDGCVFCEIANDNPAKSGQSAPTVFLATELVLGFLDIQPLVASEAHILITPRKHFATVDELTADKHSAAALGIALAEVSRALRSIVNPAAAFNIVQNNGREAGQIIDHVHFHIIIRGNSSSKPITRIVQASEAPDFRSRVSYQAQVYGRGQREDLDDDWADEIVPKLRETINRRFIDIEPRL
ncbi:hypothetical protein TRVA0_028S00738 [Trichomonascus vanleenenianus]|uniref:HIT family protein n=1 Tax=Trichomonascus vanleenenianus TaxID=2268995 RepID=UPI003ECAE746